VRSDRAGPRAARRIFGFLEHARETRFRVRKITFIVTPRFAAGLKNQAISPMACSKNARIRASWVKFQKSKRENRQGRQGRQVW
jgi:hypothetical protein